MYGDDALGVALALYRQPSLAAEWRERPLPDGIELLLRLACREQAALEAARGRSGLDANTCVEAASFGLQQLLFTARADAYRVLGGASSSSQDQLRQHYRWLIKWLHPDRHDDGWESVYADRVNLAWQALKTPERRARYEAEHGFGPPADVAPENAFSQSDEGAVGPEDGVASSRPDSAGFNAPVAFRGRVAVHGQQGASPRRRSGAWKALAAAGLVGGALLWAWPDSRDDIDPGRGLPVAFESTVRTPPQVPSPEAASGQVSLSRAMAGVDASADEAPVLADTEVAAASASAAEAAQTVPATGLTDPSSVAAAAPALDRVGQDLTAVADASDPVNEPEAAVDSVAMSAATLAVDAPTPMPTRGVPRQSDARQPAGQTIPVASPGSREVVATSIPRAPAQSVAVLDAPAAGPASSPAPSEVQARAALVPATATVSSDSPQRQTSGPKPPSGPSRASAEPTAVASSGIAQAQDQPSPVQVAKAPAAATVASVPGAARSSAEPSLADVHADQANGAASRVESAPRVDPPLAQAVVHRWVAAYSAGDSRQFDESLATGLRVPLLEQMRVRLVGASMRYLEVGEMQWEQGEAQLKAHATVRETFVPQGGRKAETRAGQMRFAFALEQGEVKIAGVEFRAN